MKINWWQMLGLALGSILFSLIFWGTGLITDTPEYIIHEHFLHGPSGEIFQMPQPEPKKSM